MSRPEAPLDQTPATRDFALTSKKGWRRGVDPVSVVSTFLNLFISLPIVFIGIMLSSTGIGAAVGVPVALAGLSIGLHERAFRRGGAEIFQSLFEREELPKQNQIADEIIAAMKPEINTDQFIGVINNLLERKEVGADLAESINKSQLSDVQKSIRLHYVRGYKEAKITRQLDDKAVLQFLLLKSVVDKLKSNPEFLPDVDRGILSAKFAEFGSKFYQHCEARYPEKMTPKCREKIGAALQKYGYSNRQEGEVRDWATGASVVVEMVPMKSGVTAGTVLDEGRSGAGGDSSEPSAAARAARVEVMKGVEAEKDGRS